jgi:type II secretory pathway pseudopilin PulG
LFVNDKVVLIGVVLAAIALPQVLGYLQGRREREEFQKRIQDLRTEIQDLGQRLERQQQVILEKLSQQQQEIDTLEFPRIVTPS